MKPVPVSNFHPTAATPLSTNAESSIRKEAELIQHLRGHLRSRQAHEAELLERLTGALRTVSPMHVSS